MIPSKTDPIVSGQYFDQSITNVYTTQMITNSIFSFSIIPVLLILSNPGLALLYFNPTKDHATSFAYWSTTTHNNSAVDLLETTNTYREVSQTRSVVPDVGEGRHGKVAAPAKSDTHAAQQRHQLVAAILGTLKAHIAASPYTPDRVDTIGLSKDIFPRNLNSNTRKCTLSQTENKLDAQVIQTYDIHDYRLTLNCV